MSFEITTAFVKQYGANVELLCQQMGSRLREAVRVESQQGQQKFFEQIGATAAVKRATRFGDTPIVSTPHSRRMVTLSYYDWADFIDTFDAIQMLIDPKSPYAQNAAAAMGRAQDEEIIAAINGTSYTGVDGTTAVALPSAQKIAHGSAGLTVAKLRTARKTLLAGNVDKSEQFFCAVTAEQLDDLLGTTEVTSSDYNSVKALVSGDVDTFLGFKFLHTQLLADDGTSRLVPCWAKSGVLLSVGHEITSSIDRLPTKNMATQVYFGMSIGATRMEEAKVVQIACNE